MATAIWAATAVVFGLALTGFWLLVTQLLRQQGRLLVRLEALEGRLGTPMPVSANGAAPGVPVGTQIESFRLSDLYEREVALEDFRGRQVLLVNWSPDCGFCELIASELAQLHERLRRERTELVFVAYGDAESNRALAEEHGLEAPILLSGSSVPAFENLGTPAAYLINKEGRTARPLALGADQVPDLARTVAAAGKKLATERSLAESRIERKGLRAGTPAPQFELPDVRGGAVSLAEYRGRKVLLVFTDPHCGPCDALAPELAQLPRASTNGAPDVVVIGRGDAEENRAKARAHGIDFPYVLQDRWKLSKQYGIFETPVAFLVDEYGVIARDVAVGPQQILSLALDSAPSRS